MPLQLAIFSSDAVMLADWSSAAHDVELSTNEHGYATLTASIDMPTVQAYYWFDRPGLPWIEVSDNADLVWRGRLEDVRLVARGIEVAAVGAWSVFGDIPYTDTPADPTTPETVVVDILGVARVDNPTLLSSSAVRIEVPGVDIYNEEYVDADMRTILTRLAAMGDDQDPPRQWEVGVWEGGRLHFRPRGTEAFSWYIDAADLEVERSLSAVWNSVYTRYDNGASVTSTATDTASVTRYGVTRRRALSSRAPSVLGVTQAERERDAALADGATPIPRARVPIDQVFNGSGARGALWNVRSGDTVTIRNLPPDAGESIDRIRTFRIAETRYRFDTNTLEVTPEAPLPSIDVLISRALEVPE